MFKAVYLPINGNKPPQDFIKLLTEKIATIPGIAEPNRNTDIFSIMRPRMLRFQSGWNGTANRQAWLAAGLTALASLESSFNWKAGRDPGASNTSPQTQEAGIFQCSANSMYFGTHLQNFFYERSGFSAGWSSNLAGNKFIALTKADHDFAVHYMLLLCRTLVRTHGPLVRSEINRWLSIDAVREFEAFFSGHHDNEEEQHPKPTGKPPRPKNYDDVYRIFGNPRESGWSSANLEFCAVDLPAFPMVSAKGKRGFYCNKLLVGQFQKCFKEIIKKKLEIYDFSGCYNLRNISGSSNLSLHSWAIAIDLNYDGNELGETKPAMDPRIVAIFKKNGFFWGGDYTGRKDPMHFEYFSRG